MLGFASHILQPVASSGTPLHYLSSSLMQDRNETQEQGDLEEESQVYNKDLFI